MLVAAIFILMLASCLLGLFVHIIVATRADNANAINRLKTSTLKIQQLENATERTFGEFKHLLEQRMRFMFVQIRKKRFENSTQTDEGSPDLELGLERQDAESQTDLGRQCSLPPLLVRPALSSDFVVPISN